MIMKIFLAQLFLIVVLSIFISMLPELMHGQIISGPAIKSYGKSAYVLQVHS